MAVKGLTTPLLRWLRVLSLFVLVRGTFEDPPTGLIPWFSKTEGNTYATLLHHPLLFEEIQRSAQEVAHTNRHDWITHVRIDENPVIRGTRSLL